MVKYIENYALYEIIGSGVYGKVYRAINNVDKKQYAVKVIPISRFRENKKLQQCTVNEINILSNIEVHPHIIRYYDMLKTTNNFYFIYEYCNGGTLQNLLSKEKKLSQPQTLLIFRQLLEAFQILNKYNIMHRDMKPDNIFFHNGTIKLGDFGFCKNLNSAEDMAKTMLGSPIYMAPEVLKGQIYSNKADIWSLGVVLYEMVFGHCPFQSNSIANLIEVLNTQNLSFPGNVSTVLKNIISRMLTKDPIQRTGWMQLFQIKINSEGFIEQNRGNNKISSLSDVKVSDESSSISTSSKSLLTNGIVNNSSKVEKVETSYTNGNEDGRNFKKNRQTAPVLETKQPQQQQSSTSNNGVNGSSIKSSQIKSISEDHKTIIDGVKLGIDLVQSKISNSMGYAFLVLNKADSQVLQLGSRSTQKDLNSLLDREHRDIKQEKDTISNKMFPYELKGLDDWKKYLRGKFFQQEKTMLLWYRMVSYLNGNRVTNNQSYKSMADTVKAILY